MIPHPLADRILDVIAELSSDGGAEPGGPLFDCYGIDRACLAPLDQAVDAWVRAGCPRSVREHGTRRRLQILLAISDAPGEHSAATLAAATGLGERMVRHHLGRLTAARLIRSTDRAGIGRFFDIRLTPRGQAALTQEPTP